MNNMYGMNQGFGGGNMFSMNQGFTQQRIPEFTQALTEEEVNKLMRGNEKEIFSANITQEQALKAFCTHKHPTTKSFTLEELPNGNKRCAICGAEINIPDNGFSDDELQLITSSFTNALQVIKTLYVDAPAQLIKEYMPLIPLAEKMPALYKMAQQNFNQYNKSSSIYNSGNNALNVLSAVLGGGGVGGMTNPMYGGYGMNMPYNQATDPNANMMGGIPTAAYYQQPTQQTMGGNPFGGYSGVGQPQQQQPVQPVFNQQTGQWVDPNTGFPVNAQQPAQQQAGGATQDPKTLDNVVIDASKFSV